LSCACHFLDVACCGEKNYAAEILAFSSAMAAKRSLIFAFNWITGSGDRRRSFLADYVSFGLDIATCGTSAFVVG